jgi:hypothetical protein
MTFACPRWCDRLQFWPRAREAFPSTMIDSSHRRGRGLMLGPRPTFPPTIQGLSPTRMLTFRMQLRKLTKLSM